MGRPLRAAEGGYVYHVLNRANARRNIFEDDGDYEAFEETLYQAVERNAKRAGLKRRAEQWRWGSLYRRQRGTVEDKTLPAAWPKARKPNWADYVNAPHTNAELAALRRSVDRGCPYGDEQWSKRTVRKLGLESTVRPRGRPKKQ